MHPCRLCGREEVQVPIPGRVTQSAILGEEPEWVAFVRASPLGKTG